LLCFRIGAEKGIWVIEGVQALPDCLALDLCLLFLPTDRGVPEVGHGYPVAIKASDEVGKLLLELFQIGAVYNMSSDLNPLVLVI
jgi:hypothetical protein